MKKIFLSLFLGAMLVLVLFPFTKVSAGYLGITTTSLPDATIGQPYSYQLQASGSNPGFTWSAPSVITPSGGYGTNCCVLGVNSNGLFSTGLEPNVLSSFQPGIYYWTVQVADSVGNVATKTLSLKINSAIAVPDFYVVSGEIAPKLPNETNAIEVSKAAIIKFFVGNKGGSYSSMPVLEWQFPTGVVPASDSGIPENSCKNLTQLAPWQSCVFAVKLIYSQVTTVSQYGSVKLVIDPQNVINESDKTNNWMVVNFDVKTAQGTAQPLSIVTAVLPDATIGQPYSVQLQAVGGVSPYTWSPVSTTYPSGCCVLGINSSGLFNTQSGSTVPTNYPAGSYSWVIQVTDANGKTAVKTLNLDIKNSGIVFQNITGPTSVNVNTSATYQFGAAYNTQDANLVYKVNWGDSQVSQDSGPNNTTSTKTFSHQWTSSGVYTITFTACPSNSSSTPCGVKTLAVTVSGTSGSVSNITPSIPNPLINVSYFTRIKFSLSGGPSWGPNVVVSGLPSGITLSNTNPGYANSIYALNQKDSNGNYYIDLAGTPTQTGSYNIQVYLFDTTHTFDVYQNYSVTVQSTATTSSSSSTTSSNGNINLPDGTIIKLPNSSTVYLISGGQLRPFSSAQDFLGQGYKWSQVQEVNPNQVSSTNSADFQNVLRDGTAVRSSSFPTIFVIRGGQKYGIPSLKVFRKLGLSLKKVVTLTDSQLDAYPDGGTQN